MIKWIEFRSLTDCALDVAAFVSQGGRSLGTGGATAPQDLVKSATNQLLNSDDSEPCLLEP